MAKDAKRNGTTDREGVSVMPQGSIVPMNTIFHPDGSIDKEATYSLVKHICVPAKPFALFENGFTAELMTTSAEQQLTNLDYVVDAVSDMKKADRSFDVKVYSGIGIPDADFGKAFERAIRQSHDSIERGADGVVLAFAQFIPSECMILDFMKRLERSMKESHRSFPVIGYDNAALHYGYFLNPEDVLADFMPFEAAVGIKVSTGKLDIFKAIGYQESFRTLMGNERQIYDGFKLGSSGHVGSLANLFPQLLNFSYKARGELQEAKERKADPDLDASEIQSFQTLISETLPKVHAYNSPKWAIWSLKYGLAKKGIGSLGKDGDPYLSNIRYMPPPTELVDGRSCSLGDAKESIEEVIRYYDGIADRIQ